MTATTSTATDYSNADIGAAWDDSQKPAAAWLRLSPRPTDGDSIKRQKSDVLKDARRRGFRIVGWYVEPAASAWDGRKSKGKVGDLIHRGRLENDAKRGEFDAVFIWKIDRLSRSVSEGLQVLAALRDTSGVDVFSYHEQQIDTTTPMGKMVATVMLMVAEMESNNASVRQKSKQQALAKNGRYHGRSPGIGHRVKERSEGDGGGVLELHPQQAEAIQIAVAEFLDRDASYDEIAEILHREGGVTRQTRAKTHEDEYGNAFYEMQDADKPIAVQAVRQLLMNPRLAGLRVHQLDNHLPRNVNGNPSRAVKHILAANRKAIVRDEDGDPIEFAPPIIDQETLERVWVKLEGKADANVRSGRATRTQDELTKLLVCGDCGHVLYRQQTTDRRTGKPTAKSWYCPSKYQKLGGRKCRGVAVKDTVALTFLIRTLKGTLTRERMDRARELAAQQTVAQGEANPNAERLAEIRDELDLLDEGRTAGMFPGREGTRRWMAESARLTAEMEQLEHHTAASGDIPSLPILDPETEMGTWWRAADVNERAKLLGKLVREVRVKKFTDGNSEGRFEVVLQPWIDRAVRQRPSETGPDRI